MIPTVKSNWRIHLVSNKRKQVKFSFEQLIENHGSAKVLAVDDNQKNIQVIGHLLKGVSWCSLSVCLDSEKAINLASKIRPDIILLDLHMPKLSGIDVLNKLKKMEILENSTVIFLTADREIENRIEGLSLGCADYIQKPFNSEEFIIKLKYHIKMRLYEKEILNTLKNTNNLLDNINQAIFSINKSGEIINPISKHSNEIFGSSVEPGHNIRDFFEDKFQFSKPEIKSIVEELLISFKKTKVYWTEVTRKLPRKYIFSESENNEKKVLQIKYSSVWKDQELENIIFYFNDITNKEKKDDDSIKYSLSQISSISGINLETLRSWTKRFNIKGSFYDKESKYRFSGRELKIFQLYKYLIEKGENIGALVKLNYDELINRRKALTEYKSQLSNDDNSKIKSFDLVKTLNFFMTQKKFDIFQRDFNKLSSIYDQRELVFDIILPFLKLRSTEKGWSKLSTSKKEFLTHYFIKKIIEFSTPKKSVSENENQRIYLLDIFPSNKSLICPLISLLSSYHNIESYYIKEDILAPSFQELLRDEKNPIILLNLDKKGSFDETDFNVIKKDLMSSTLLKKHNIYIFNNHPTIKIEKEKEFQVNLLHSFEEIDQFFLDLLDEITRVKKAA